MHISVVLDRVTASAAAPPPHLLRQPALTSLRPFRARRRDRSANAVAVDDHDLSLEFFLLMRAAASLRRDQSDRDPKHARPRSRDGVSFDDERKSER